MKPFKLEQYFSEFEFTAKYLLSSSDCEPLGLNEVLQMADEECLDLWNNLKLAYNETQGLPVLRKEIATLYKDIQDSQVMVVTPEEGIYLSMTTLLNKNDEVICTFPGYQSLYEIAESKVCHVKYWKPDRDNVFQTIDLENLLSDNTRMVVFNFPHNPTGAYPSQEDYNKIIQLCEERNILIFSDEMYRGLEYNSESKLPSIADVYSNSIVLSGMSKTYSLPGLRLGWLVIQDPDIYKKIEDYKHYTTICPPAPSEILALIAIRNKDLIIKNNLETIHKNIGLMEEFAEEFQDIIRWIPPKAGSIAFPELLLDKDIEKFCRCLVDKTGVMLLPGSVYDYPGRYFRIGLGRKGFGRGLEKFSRFLK